MHLDLISTIRRYYQIWLETNNLYFYLYDKE